jgi:hypothetical protein
MGKKNLCPQQYYHCLLELRFFLCSSIEAFGLPLTDLFVVKIDWSFRDLSGASPPPRRDDLSII